jgi:hypothetical protein
MEDLLSKIKEYEPKKTELQERDFEDKIRESKNKFFNIYTKDVVRPNSSLL